MNLGQKYQKALDKHTRNEKQLTRAMNAWQKSKATLSRLNKKLDEIQWKNSSSA